MTAMFFAIRALARDALGMIRYCMYVFHDPARFVVRGVRLCLFVYDYAACRHGWKYKWNGGQGLKNDKTD